MIIEPMMLNPHSCHVKQDPISDDGDIGDLLFQSILSTLEHEWVEQLQW